MWVSDKWRDYELLDCSDAERLERWGEYLLVRPDPQAIWSTPREDARWLSPDAKYLRSSSGGGSWSRNRLPASWQVHYGNLAFHVKPMNFKHTGIFPEQAVNWDFMADKIRTAGRPVSVLSLFAYTGASTVACAAAGASVCHVDAARGIVALARENAKLNGLQSAPIRWIVDDCVQFVEREIRRGRRYDAIVMDPPSYGRGPSGEVWKIEAALWPFLSSCVSVLSDSPLFFIINSYSTGLAPSVLSYMLRSALGPRFGGVVAADELGLPVTASGLALPSGACGRWIKQCMGATK